MHQHPALAADAGGGVDGEEHVLGLEPGGVLRRQRRDDAHRRVGPDVQLAEVGLGREADPAVALLLAGLARGAGEDRRPLAARLGEVLVHVVGLDVEDELVAAQLVERGAGVLGGVLRHLVRPAQALAAVDASSSEQALSMKIVAAAPIEELRKRRRLTPRRRARSSASRMGAADDLLQLRRERRRVELAVRHRAELDGQLVFVSHGRSPHERDPSYTPPRRPQPPTLDQRSTAGHARPARDHE